MSDETPEVEETEETVEDQRAPYVHPGGRDFRVEGNDVRDYVGVAGPEYMSYANEYDRPILTDQERLELTNQYDHLVGNADADFEPQAEESEASEPEAQDNETQPEGEGQTTLPPLA